MSFTSFSGLDWLVLLAVSWGLFILIWLIQLVHYPSFRFIEPQDFTAFHQHHTTSITLIVMPLMLCELVNVLWLTYKSGFSAVFLLLSGIVIGIWISTFWVSVPLHGQMAQVKNSEAIEKLIQTNWIRTILWTVKVGIVTLLFLKNVKNC